MSNWELRPLRPSQIHYSISDAYIMVKVFNHFIETLVRKNRILFLCDIQGDEAYDFLGSLQFSHPISDSRIIADPDELFSIDLIKRAQELEDIGVKPVLQDKKQGTFVQKKIE